MNVIASFATALIAAWAVALITRLPPGMLEIGACRMLTNAGARAAAAFLVGITLLDTVFTATLLGTGWIGPGRKLPPLVILFAGLAICALAIRRLVRAGRPSQGGSVAFGVPVIVGMRAALESPGWWNWWLLVGSVTVAAGTVAPIAVGFGLMAGILSWGVVVFLTIRFGHRLIARVENRRWDLISGGLLLLGGALMAARVAFLL